MKRWMMIKVMAIGIALVLFSFQAWATPVLLPSSPQPTNAGDGTIQAWLILMITNYNTSNDSDLPTAPVGATPDIKVNTGDVPPSGYPSFGSGTLSITLPGNLNDYLVLHWGGPGGGTYQAFYLTAAPELSATFSFTAPGKYGLSFYSFYDAPTNGGGGQNTHAPEPATLLLLGAGLVGLSGYARRKMKR